MMNSNERKNHLLQKVKIGCSDSIRDGVKFEDEISFFSQMQFYTSVIDPVH